MGMVKYALNSESTWIKNWQLKGIKKTLGNQMALKIYLKLLEVTREIKLILILLKAQSHVESKH